MIGSRTSGRMGWFLSWLRTSLLLALIGFSTSCAPPDGREHDAQGLFSMISPEGWTRRAGGLGITLILYSEEQRRCKLVATVMRFDAQSRKAKMIAEAGTIEMIVRDPIRFRIGAVLPKHRDDFRSISVGGMPAVRGPLEGGVGGKIWVGEQVLGFRDNLWLRIKAYAIDPNDDAGHLLSSQALDALLSSLRIN